jgi:hypothetical protein
MPHASVPAMRHLFSFESRHQPLISREAFARRLGRNALWGLGFIAVGLVIGMSGYMTFEGMGFVDAFVNAAMILSTMGPLQPLTTTSAKIFAGLYALASGVFIFALATIVFAPVLHRVMHKFNLDDDEASDRRRK